MTAGAPGKDCGGFAMGVTTRRIAMAMAGIVMLLLPGCVTSSGMMIFGARVNEIEPGKTSKEDIRGSFGNPYENVTTSGGRAIWRYRYSQKALLLQFFQHLEIVFDRANKVADYTFIFWNPKTHPLSQ